MGRIFSRPLDRSRPLWELDLIHGLGRGAVAGGIPGLTTVGRVVGRVQRAVGRGRVVGRLDVTPPRGAVSDLGGHGRNGLNIIVMSYCGQLDFGIVADREQMPDVRSPITWQRDALEELRPRSPESAPSAAPTAPASADRRGDG